MHLHRQLSGRKAVLYRRVSSDEQAEGYSLRAQHESLLPAEAQQGIEVVADFEDDGYSAKTFDRPAWGRLLAWCRANPRGVDYVFFTKWSRFGRNISESFGQIDQLRLRLGIEPQAIEQWVSYDDPNHVYILAINLAEPDAANRWLSINTKQGMRRALKEGRWCTTPPYGYERARDESDRSIIVPGPAAAVVQLAFELVATREDLSVSDVRLAARQEALRRGLRFTISRGHFYYLLRNPAYLGKIYIPAWKEEPEQLVEGLHEALVSKSTFDAVQKRLSQAPRHGRRAEIVPDLVLRGHLVCPACGRLWTGSASRGRSGARHWYYHCNQTHFGCRARARAGVVHDAFEHMLGEVRLASEVARLYEVVLADIAADDRRRQTQRRRQLETEMALVDDKLFRADEALLEGTLSREAYDRLTRRYSQERARQAMLLAELQAVEEGLEEAIRYTLRLLDELPLVWKRADAAGRAALVGSIFPEKLVFDGDSVRTTCADTLVGLFSGKTQKTRDSDTLSDAAVLSGTPGLTLLEPTRRRQIIQIYRNQYLWAA